VLLVEAERHTADYVLIHSLSFEYNHLGGEAVTATAQLLNDEGTANEAPWSSHT